MQLIASLRIAFGWAPGLPLDRNINKEICYLILANLRTIRRGFESSEIAQSPNARPQAHFVTTVMPYLGLNPT